MNTIGDKKWNLQQKKAKNIIFQPESSPYTIFKY